MTVVSSTNTSAGLARVAVPLVTRTESGGPELKSSAAVSASVKLADHASNGAVESVNATQKALSKAEVASQIQELQTKMDKLNPALAFVLDQASGRALIQLTDRNTKEVIQQFPTAAAMQISRALDRFEKGQLVNRIA